MKCTCMNGIMYYYGADQLSITSCVCHIIILAILASMYILQLIGRSESNLRYHVAYYTWVKNIPAIISRNLLVKYCSILIIFGRNILEKIWLEMMI